MKGFKTMKSLQNLKAKTIRKDINTLTLDEFAKKYVKNGYFKTEEQAKKYWWSK